MTRGSGGTKTSDLVEDPHITCLDTFSLSPVQVSHAPTPLEAFCQIPADNPRRDVPPTVSLAPGLDACDFYSISERSEVWVDCETIECLVPPLLLGWEFYTLLRPEPEGSSPVLLNPDSDNPIVLLFGRPPGAQKCPSILFIIVPPGQQYESPETTSTNTRRRRSSLGAGTGKALGNMMPYNLEKACDNLDSKGCSILPRLLALCPTHVYDDNAVLPEGNAWGLFVGPRHRSLVLLNKTRGRIDVHLLMLFSTDAVFWKGQTLIDATARLYEPFGTEEQAKKLFAELDPLKAHCGLTNALIPEHVNTTLDGRDEYRLYLGIWPPSFFVSNCSDNLRFLTPAETKQHRNGQRSMRRSGTEGPAVRELPVPRWFEDFPKWSLGGNECTSQQRTALRKYRADVMPRAAPGESQNTWKNGVLQLLGLHNSGGEDSWSKMVGKIGGCAEVTFAGTEVWHEPMSYIVDTKNSGRRKKQEMENEALAPAWLSKMMQESDNPGPKINWRNTQGFIPGADFDEDEESQYAPSSGGSRTGTTANHHRWSVMPGVGDSMVPAPVPSRPSHRYSLRSPRRNSETSNNSGSGRRSLPVQHETSLTGSLEQSPRPLSRIPEESGMSQAQAASLPPP